MKGLTSDLTMLMGFNSILSNAVVVSWQSPKDDFFYFQDVLPVLLWAPLLPARRRGPNGWWFGRASAPGELAPRSEKAVCRLPSDEEVSSCCVILGISTSSWSGCLHTTQHDSLV